MAHVGGFLAAKYAQIVPGVAAAGSFDASGLRTVAGKAAFTALADGDTIAYRATSMDEPSKFEVGVMTYVAATETFTRADATVHYSSTSNNRVNFLKSDGAGANVLLEGLALVAPYAWTVTNHTATRAISGTETSAAAVAVALSALVTDLKAAGVLA